MTVTAAVRITEAIAGLIAFLFFLSFVLGLLNFDIDSLSFLTVL